MWRGSARPTAGGDSRLWRARFVFTVNTWCNPHDIYWCVLHVSKRRTLNPHLCNIYLSRYKTWNACHKYTEGKTVLTSMWIYNQENVYSEILLPLNWINYAIFTSFISVTAIMSPFYTGWIFVNIDAHFLGEYIFSFELWDLMFPTCPFLKFLWNVSYKLHVADLSQSWRDSPSQLIFPFLFDHEKQNSCETWPLLYPNKSLYLRISS